MRSRITLIVILISIILVSIAAFKGIKIGGLEILSISEIQKKNSTLEEKIEEASTLSSVNYPDNIKTLEETYDRYIIQKQKFEQLSGASSEIDEEIYETKQYDIGYLWRVLGKYANNRKLDLGIEVQKSNIGNSAYNFIFTLKGKYVNISQFITDIENDSDLYFRIYNFDMSGSGEKVTATFTVRNVGIDPSTIIQTTTNNTIITEE